MFRLSGRDAEPNYQLAREIRDKVAVIPGAVDVFIRQEVNTPTVGECGSVMANQAGLTQRDVANSMLISLSSSGQVRPTVAQSAERRELPGYVQTPQYRVDSFDALKQTPMTPANDSSTQLSGQHGHPASAPYPPSLVNHYDVQPVFDVYGNADRRDLGGVASRRAENHRQL